METKIMKKPIQRVVTDETTKLLIVLRQSVVLTCYERGEADQISCSVCPYSEVACERLEMTFPSQSQKLHIVAEGAQADV